MKATTYYFSGTGNSLHVAGKIAGAMPVSDLASMASLIDAKEIEEKSDVLGLVFPVYFWDVPAFVSAFIRKLKITGQPYIFAVATCGGGPGNTLFTVERMLREKGQKLSAGFTIDMPSNAYVGFDLMTPKDQWSQMLEDAEKKIGEIAGKIACKAMVPVPGKRSALKTTGTFVMEQGATKGYNLPRHYRADEHCDACGICQKICPAGNIRLAEKKVIWGDSCAYCQACFHWCPRQAIQLNKKTPAIPRYHHPQITVRDMETR